jgi:hypothetical protein
MNDDIIETTKPALPEADGIYFGLDEKVYHAIPRLSMSGIQNIMVSPADFWARSWMNPNREADAGKETNAQILGRAYHTARFEPMKFDATYCRDLDQSDMPPGTLFTDSEISAALEALGEPKTKKSEKVLDKAMRLIDAGYDGTVWHYERAMFEAGLGDMIPIKADIYDQLRIDIDTIHNNPEVAAFLTGGEPEVSLLYTDEATGVKMKSRVDFLRPRGMTDFKTFDNTQGKHVQNAIMSAIKYNRYYIQAFGYWSAVELIRAGGLGIVGDATEAQIELVNRIRLRTAPMDCWYVFQQKSGVPNVFAVEFPAYAAHESVDMNASGLTEDEAEAARYRMAAATFIRTKAVREIRNAIEVFVKYSEIYEPGQPWYPVKPIMDAGDQAYGSFWLEEIWNG